MNNEVKTPRPDLPPKEFRFDDAAAYRIGRLIGAIMKDYGSACFDAFDKRAAVIKASGGTYPAMVIGVLPWPDSTVLANPDGEEYGPLMVSPKDLILVLAFGASQGFLSQGSVAKVFAWAASLPEDKDAAYNSFSAKTYIRLGKAA